MGQGKTCSRQHRNRKGGVVTRILSNKYLILISRIILGVVFIIASVEKIASPDAFAASIQAYNIAPVAVVNLSALVLAWLELLCGVFILSGVLVRSSAAIVTFLIGVFVAAMLAAMARGLQIDCGCFGTHHATPLGWARILEDAALLIPGIHLIAYPYPEFSIENFFISVRQE
jgi:putative oxidoreductase